MCRAPTKVIVCQCVSLGKETPARLERSSPHNYFVIKVDAQAGKRFAKGNMARVEVISVCALKSERVIVELRPATRENRWSTEMGERTELVSSALRRLS